ncbi:hypothetical protein RND71_041668 [Anisodus tanguticus]|uniref:Uncharacterized protein n=1 Tax=Anisodus tanguticus TaxID=243964 RepID=A0AAE1QVI9_9SOLA|nr:hypothetical protein RND71_041668 [Anisodus tanguticus]
MENERLDRVVANKEKLDKSDGSRLNCKHGDRVLELIRVEKMACGPPNILLPSGDIGTGVDEEESNTITLDPLGVTQSWTSPDICNYKGFYCDNPPHNSSAISLASIDFNGFQLSAPTLDGFIDQLPDLAIFHANSNNFSGIISSKISNLPYLYELDLSNNNFIGTFPISILKIKTLTFLDIRYNLFTGIIPPQIFVQNLDAFFLNNNNFIQKLPDNLGSTPAFYLTLANNKFIGPIPRSIGQAPNLLEILLLNNLLNGCIPYELGLLKKAIVIDVEFNMLTGPLPYSLGCLESVEQLNFAGNLLNGQVPEVICSLKNLVNFTLSYNYFTRVGPICRGLIKNGVLNVEKNCIFDLPNQRSFVERLLVLLLRIPHTSEAEH